LLHRLSPEATAQAMQPQVKKNSASAKRAMLSWMMQAKQFKGAAKSVRTFTML
jgi:hypothetical protein